jgi:hypothetical protein
MSSKPVNSYERKKTVDSNEVEIVGQVQDAKEVLGTKGHEIDTDRVISTEQIDREAFMRDEMEIILMEPNNENEAQFCEVNVNGDYKLLLRNGEPQTLRRYHVAVLAQAKQSRVRQKKIVQPDGSMGFVEENVLSLTYPFSVSHDPNPKQGAPWLRQMLANPV